MNQSNPAAARCDWSNNLLAIPPSLHSVRKMLTRGPEQSTLQTEISVFHRLAPHMQALDSFMQQQVAQFEPEIRSMAAYCLDATGKRLRPSLVFISGWKGEGAVLPELVQAAGVVEMVHLATLVHDDIMDRAEIRRNRRTAVREFGPDAAVLLGDALFAQALHTASRFPTTEVCRIISESTRRVCSGEITQTLRRRDLTISLEEYRRMIDLKTAELFRSSCFLGARLAGYTADFAEAADRFGHHLGIAYQIYDDLLDFVGEEQQQGKTLGTDLATGKLTLPLMLLLGKIAGEERERLIHALADGMGKEATTSRQQMFDLGIPSEVVQAIEDELARAESSLEAHATLPPVNLMRELAAMLRRQVLLLASQTVSH